MGGCRGVVVFIVSGRGARGDVERVCVGRGIRARWLEIPLLNYYIDNSFTVHTPNSYSCYGGNIHALMLQIQSM